LSPIVTDPTSEAIASRRLEIRRRIDASALAGDRDPAGVRLIAVTKGFGVDVVRAAQRVGLDRFGESRVQEAEAKIAAVPDAEWHLIGHLQSNKARRAAALFGWLHAVDSVSLLGRVDDVATDLGRQPRVLVQVNLTASPTQHGFALDELSASTTTRGALRTAVSGLRSVTVVGLMAIGPVAGDPATSRSHFAHLRRLRDDLEQVLGLALPELSMGMSDDFEPAIIEGATLIRVGTALFGARSPSG
jgi:hypothetical protein